MSNKPTTTVRAVTDQIRIIDVRGDLTAQSEEMLTNAYDEASKNGAKAIILNLEGLDYMNSSGIGLLVTMLIRVQRNRQRLLAYGLTDHYQQIFELTRLDEAIGIFTDEAAARAAVFKPA